MLPFGPYRPDMAKTNPGVTDHAVNVNPRRDALGVSYHPRQGLTVPSTADALPAASRGSLAVVTRAGAFKGYFGTVSKLYSLDADYGFTEIGTGYAVPIDENWGRTQYGDRLLVTNSFDGMLQHNIEIGGAVTAISGAPKAAGLFVAFECVFALDCDGDNRLLRNSAPGDYTNWKTRGAGAQEFADGEALMGGGLLNDGQAVVIQKSAVSLLTAVGGTLIYRKDKIADGVGAETRECIVAAPGAVYFYHSSGFYRVTAAGMEPIGQDKVNLSFAAKLGQIDGLTGSYDPKNRQVVWRYAAGGVSGEVFYNLIAFDIATGEFVEIEQATSDLMRMSSPAYTLEDLDAFGSLDALPFSLDSAVWKGGRPTLAALDESRKFGFFSGANLLASVDTATLTDIKTMLVTWAAPVTDAPDLTLELMVADRLIDSGTWKEPASMTASGRVPLRGRGKVIKMRAEIPASSEWTYLRGIDDLVITKGGPK